jgi:hypothetical protein
MIIRDSDGVMLKLAWPGNANTYLPLNFNENILCKLGNLCAQYVLNFPHLGSKRMYILKELT